MSYTGREKKGGNEGKIHARKDSKSKKGIDVSELMNFHYERPAQQAASQRSNRKYIPRSSYQQVSKAQFVQAHFRFLLSPLTNPLEPCLYEPDTIVPWQFISCVLLPPPLRRLGSSNTGQSNGPSQEAPWVAEGSPAVSAADYEAAEVEHSILTCPICLDDVQIPRMTSCGHTFCYTCILRHLYSELSNANKCPICAVAMCASDLKTVLHHDDNLHNIFRAPTTSISSPASNRATSSGFDGLVMGQEAEFTLLQINKGSIAPSLQSAQSNAASSNTESFAGATSGSGSSIGGGGGSQLALGQVLPVCTAECAPYNRLTHLTLDMMRQLFEYEKEQLQAFRRRCLPPEASTVKSNAGSNNAKAAPSALDNTATSSPAQSVWATKKAATGNSSISVNSSGPGTSAALATGDVEALPFIQLAFERQQQAETDFEAKLAQRALVTNLLGEHSTAPTHTHTTSTSATTAGTPESSAACAEGMSASWAVALQDKSVYHIYQHTSGALIFLHPICTKALLEAHTVDTAPGGRNLNPTRSPAGSPRTANSNRKHALVPPSADQTMDPSVSEPCQANISSIADCTAQLSVTGISAISTSAAQAASAVTTFKQTLRGKIIDIECVRVNAEVRQRYSVLRHLPVHSEVLLLEIDLHSMVPAHVLCKYAEELSKRAAKRRERARQEKREKRLDQDRSMAEALLAQERHDYLMAQRAAAHYELQQLLQGPSLDVYSGGPTSNTSSYSSYSSSSESYSSGTAAGDSSSAMNSTRGGGGGTFGNGTSANLSTIQSEAVLPSSVEISVKTVSSFATITEMGGNFPTLGQAAAGAHRGHGGSTTTSTSSGATSSTTTTTVWGTPSTKAAGKEASTAAKAGAALGPRHVSNMGVTGSTSGAGGIGISSDTVAADGGAVEGDGGQAVVPQGGGGGGSGSGKKGNNKKTKIVLMTRLAKATYE